MSAIRSKNTKPELLVRKALHAAGFRFRLHGENLPGRPDLVLSKYKSVIFVHGCFWHGHTCKYFKVPKTRSEFWISKIEANRARDEANIESLNRLGWHVILIWECATKAGGLDIQEIVTRVAACLTGLGTQSAPSVTSISA